jgi:hypothetical protein
MTGLHLSTLLGIMDMGMEGMGMDMDMDMDIGIDMNIVSLPRGWIQEIKCMYLVLLMAWFIFNLNTK